MPQHPIVQRECQLLSLHNCCANIASDPIIAQLSAVSSFRSTYPPFQRGENAHSTLRGRRRHNVRAQIQWEAVCQVHRSLHRIRPVRGALPTDNALAAAGLERRAQNAQFRLLAGVILNEYRCDRRR